MMSSVGREVAGGRAGRELGWRPAHPSWREGFAEIASLATRHAA